MYGDVQFVEEENTEKKDERLSKQNLIPTDNFDGWCIIQDVFVTTRQ